MTLIKKVSAGLLLAFGTVLLLIGVIGGVAYKDSKDKADILAGGLLLGLPPALLGGWLARSLYLQREREQHDRLQAAFYKLIKQGNGKITTLAFAMETGLDGKTAKAYLDERAREFIANFDVNADGSLFYQFDAGNLSSSQIPYPSIAENTSLGAFDVILERVPNDCKISAIKVVRELTNLGLKEAKDLVEATPTKVREGVSQAVAQNCQRKLEAIGATVMVIEN